MERSKHAFETMATSRTCRIWYRRTSCSLDARQNGDEMFRRRMLLLEEIEKKKFIIKKGGPLKWILFLLNITSSYEPESSFFIQIIGPTNLFDARRVF